MFGGCVSLKELDISKLYTNNISDMSYLFYQCQSITKINLSNFNTTNVTNMQFMFYGCYSLEDINILYIELISLKYLDRFLSNFQINIKKLYF